MKKWKFTKVFRIDNRLVIGDSIEDAISVYKSYINDSSIEIRRIEALSSFIGETTNTDAIIEE